MNGADSINTLLVFLKDDNEARLSKIAWNSDTMAIWLGYKYTKLVNFVSSRENSSENLRFAAGSSLFEIPNTFYSGDIYSKHSQKFP